MLASISGLSEVVNLLLSAGADLHLKDRLGLTAVEWSKRRGFLEVADLIENSAKHSAESTQTTTSEQPLTESGSEIDPGSVVPGTTELSGLAQQIEDTAKKEGIQPDDVERIQTQELSGLAQQIEDTVEKEGIQPDDVARIQTQEPSGPATQVEEKEKEERIRLDHVARIQALFDQLSVADEKTTTHEIKVPSESGAPAKVISTRSPQEEQKLRQERLKAEDERISRAHRGEDLNISETQANLRSSQEQNSVKTELAGDTVDAERAANELAREKSRLDAERIAEENRLRVEEEVRKRSLRQEQEGSRIKPEPVSARSEDAAAFPSGDGSRFPTERAKESAKRVKEDQARQSSPRGMRIITQDIWAVQPTTQVASSTTSEPAAIAPVKRCPKCNSAMEGELCPACVSDQLSVISVPSFSSPHSNLLARPTVWMLMSVTLAGGVLIGYQLNEYMSKNETSSAPLAAAPVTQSVSAKPEMTPEAPPDSPLVGGDLRGAEASIPEPEYPARARSEALSGKITVRVRVNNRGRVILARSSSGDWRLRAAAVQAAKKATFLPEKLSADDKPVSGTITYTFKPSP